MSHIFLLLSQTNNYYGDVTACSSKNFKFFSSKFVVVALIPGANFLLRYLSKKLDFFFITYYFPDLVTNDLCSMLHPFFNLHINFLFNFAYLTSCTHCFFFFQPFLILIYYVYLNKKKISYYF